MIVMFPLDAGGGGSGATPDGGAPLPAIERPARLAFVNLMPDQEMARQRIATVFAHAERTVDLVSLRPDEAALSVEDELGLEGNPVDGLLVIGAPEKPNAFESDADWAGLVPIFDWAAARRLPGLFVGWAAQAVLYHRHGIVPSPLAAPARGIVEQEVLAPCSPYLLGIGRRFSLPVIRQTKVRWAALAESRGLTALATATRTGLSLIEEPATRSLMLFDHLECEDGASGTAGKLFGNWLDEAIRHCRAAA